MPTFGSLFAGIGGIDLGLERAGWTGRWQVEWDEFCQRVLAKHWPDIPRYGDITTVDWSGVEPVDLIAGGFPCQPVSLAGRQLAQDDERWLWPEFARAIRCLRPRVVLVENVPGLLVRGMGDVQRDLAELGYRRGWGVLSAADVGAPHLRRRVWIVAHADGDEYEGRSYAKWWTTAQDLFTNADGPDLWDEPVAFEWSIGEAEPRDDSQAWTVAERDACPECGHIWRYHGWDERGCQAVGDNDGLCRCPEPLADADGKRLQGLGISRLPRLGDASLGDNADGRRGSVPDAASIGRRERWTGRPAGDRTGQSELAYGPLADATGERQPGSGIAERPGDPTPDRDGQAGQPLDGRPVADAAGGRREWRGPGTGPEEGGRSFGLSARSDEGSGANWWLTEPDVGRVAHGVPSRVDRLRSLGNAVVPQVVEVIGRRLLEIA